MKYQIIIMGFWGMRDIKFRVWDNLEKAYLNEEDVAIDNRGNVFIFEIYDKNDSDLWYTRLLPDSDNKRYIIEQDKWNAGKEA